MVCWVSLDYRSRTLKLIKIPTPVLITYHLRSSYIFVQLCIKLVLIFSFFASVNESRWVSFRMMGGQCISQRYQFIIRITDKLYFFLPRLAGLAAEATATAGFDGVEVFVSVRARLGVLPLALLPLLLVVVIAGDGTVTDGDDSFFSLSLSLSSLSTIASLDGGRFFWSFCFSSVDNVSNDDANVDDPGADGNDATFASSIAFAAFAAFE
jgi:hypothetical protein